MLLIFLACLHFWKSLLCSKARNIQKWFMKSWNSLDLFKGIFTGKPHIYWENLWFPVDFPLNQSIEKCHGSKHPAFFGPPSGPIPRGPQFLAATATPAAAEPLARMAGRYEHLPLGGCWCCWCPHLWMTVWKDPPFYSWENPLFLWKIYG